MKKIVFLFLFVLPLVTVKSQFPMMSEMDPVSWSFRSEPLREGVYNLFISASIEDPWHMYAIRQEKSGPIPTTVSFTVNDEFELLGELKELKEPKIKYDEGFQFNVGAYYNSAEFVQKVKVLAEGSVIVKGSVEYQCCDDETCLPPFLKEFSFSLEGSGTETISGQSQTNTDATGSNLAAKVSENDERKDPVSGELDEKEQGIISPKSRVSVQQSSMDSKGENIAGGSNAETVEIAVGSESDDDEGTAGRSMAGFLIITFLLGLAAILTPCVYPMIPMTVSFFMRETKNKSLVVIKGLVFGLSIVAAYTGLGALVALTGMDANFGNVISSHWIPNSIFFILFLIFALSFFGMFEIVLPSGFVNKVDRQADRGGLPGSFFMGITTVVVSFSCTGPIVGSLLAEAAGGDVMKPILGMFFFSLAFALPFTFLAIFPSMLKNLPKSGAWLNSIKVVLGFLMLGFGMKFLSSIDQAYHLDIFSREVYLAIWFVLSVFLGFYLLGKIKLPHDSDMPYIKVPRLLFAAAVFVFSIYIFTGIFGNDLKSISAFIPPKSSQSFVIGGNSSTLAVVDNQSDTWCGPGKYDDLFELPHGIKGYFDYESGMSCAKEKAKPVFLDFTGHFCSNCKQMENQVWTDPEVLQRLKEEYVVISLYTDDKTKLAGEEWITTEEGDVLKTIGEQNVYFELQKFNTFATPWYVLLDSEGNLLNEPIGKNLNIPAYLSFLDEGLEEFRNRN